MRGVRVVASVIVQHCSNVLQSVWCWYVFDVQRSLPMLRHAMLVNKLEIENITPPPIGFLHFPMSASSLSRPPPMSTVSSQQHPPALRHQVTVCGFIQFLPYYTHICMYVSACLHTHVCMCLHVYTLIYVYI